MEVDGDDVVEAGLDAHVRHQLEADVPPPAHLRLLAVGQAGQHPDDVLAVAGLAGVRHDQQLHDDVVDVPGCCLQDIDIFAPDRLLDVHHCFPGKDIIGVLI